MDALFPAFVIHDELQLLNMASTSLIVFGMIVIVLYDKMPTYGRYVSNMDQGNLSVRPTINWFFHELPAFCIPCVLLYITKNDIRRASSPNAVVLGLFLVHYFHRTFIYPFIQNGKHVVPLNTFISAMLFTTFNGYLQGRFLTEYAKYGEVWLRNPIFVCGAITFCTGMIINIHSDYLLRSLRREGDYSYKIPKGGLFEYVSCANYFGEIIEWFGFALASHTYSALAFAIFTACFLGHRASHHHMFYKNKFEDYPKDRRILVPFIW